LTCHEDQTIIDVVKLDSVDLIIAVHHDFSDDSVFGRQNYISIALAAILLQRKFALRIIRKDNIQTKALRVVLETNDTSVVRETFSRWELEIW
jgi:hypothetical protein